MQISRFQLGLVTVMALATGLALSSHPAEGYPTAAVSRGSNPIWNAGGQLHSGLSVEIVTAPEDQDAILVDLIITKDAGDTPCELVLSDGTTVGSYFIQGGDSDKAGTPVIHNHSAGIRVPAGMTLTMNNLGSYYVRYAVAGYYSQP